MTQYLPVLVLILVCLNDHTIAQTPILPIELESLTARLTRNGDARNELELSFKALESGYLAVPSSVALASPLIDVRNPARPILHLEIVNEFDVPGATNVEQLSYELVALDVGSTQTIRIEFEQSHYLAPLHSDSTHAEAVRSCQGIEFLEIRVGFVPTCRWEQLRPRIAGFFPESGPLLIGSFIVPLIRVEQSVVTWSVPWSNSPADSPHRR